MFEKTLNCARDIVSDLRIEQVFLEKNNKRIIFNKRHFDESYVRPSELIHELSPQESFRIQYSVYIGDQVFCVHR